MSAACPHGHIQDESRTTFGVCLEAVRTLDPTRPDPTQTRAVEGEGLSVSSPSPCSSSLQWEVWQILVGGLHSLSGNDFGRPWPYPQREVLARLLAEHGDDLCLKAAREAREIVQSQDRAPNITGLFEKKLRELSAKRATVRESLGVAA